MCDNDYWMSGMSLAENEYRFYARQRGVHGIVMSMDSEARGLPDSEFSLLLAGCAILKEVI